MPFKGVKFESDPFKLLIFPISNHTCIISVVFKSNFSKMLGSLADKEDLFSKRYFFL